MNIDDIKEFNLNTMIPNPSILVIGESSKKNLLIQQLLYHFRNLPGGTVISSEKQTKFYQQYFPNAYLHQNTDHSIYQRILVRQTQIIERKIDGANNDPKAILIMDECLENDESWADNVDILEILMNGRHYELTYILSTQPQIDIPSYLRLNFDYVFLLADAQNKNQLWNGYASEFEFYTDFEKIYEECIEHYGAMVINQRSLSNDISQKVFFFNNQVFMEDFNFGSDTFRNLPKQIDSTTIIDETEYFFDYFINEKKIEKNLYL